MENDFYFLDESEQKGPFKIDQLRTVGLKPDTLVWTDGFENWRPAKDVEELKTLLKKIPPPPPIIDNIKLSTAYNEKETSDEKVTLEDSNIKSWIIFKIYVFIFLIIGILTLSIFLIINDKKAKLKNEIYAKVDKIFNGKTVVLDGEQSLTQGVLKETDYGRTKIKNNDSFADIFEEWWREEKLYAVYNASNTGFIVKQLTRQNDDGFNIEIIQSGDMGYKKSSSSYIPPEYIDDGYGGKYKIGGGYQTRNYRLPIRQCYTQAFEYFTKEDKKSPGAFSPGRFVDITNFPALKNQYFYMDNTAPKDYTTGISSSSWQTSGGDHGSNINGGDWIVYYNMQGKHYELTENNEAINKDTYTYMAITVIPLFFILFTSLLSKPKYFKNLNLYGKRWKNISYQDQLFLFEHSFLGQHTFTEIVNDTVSKGIFKITDRGSTLNLSYPTKEIFYKIDKIDADNLSLVSLKDKTKIAFLRVGIKEKEENHN